MGDIRKLRKNPLHGIITSPDPNNVLLWHATMEGPPDTLFEGATFLLSLQFSEEYPRRPPVVKFLSQVFHPNVYTNGSICLDILENKKWNPVYDAGAILQSIQSLLSDPNPESPANAEAAKLFSTDQREYRRRCRMCVEHSWMQ